MRPIYLDHHATTPLDPRVLEAMLPFLREKFGNAASRQHSLGSEAEAAVEEARGRVASLLGATAEEIVFTSGATESDNLALKGVARANRDRGDHVVASAIEHRAVLDALRRLEGEGFRVTLVPVDALGRVDPAAVRAAITERTVVVSVMAANNEVGTVQPFPEIGEACRERGVPFHTDAAQAAGKIPIDLRSMRIDLLSLSAHKMHGPKGAGALYVRRSSPPLRLEPLLDGGGHERGVRSGTLNVPAIVGLGAACEIARAEGPSEARRLSRLRDRLRRGLCEALDLVELNGHPEERLPGNLNLSFRHVEAEAIFAGVPEIALSSGSACTTASREPSHVLRAMGFDEERIQGSVRFGLGRFTTEEEIDAAIQRLAGEARRLRALSPFYEVHRRGAPRARSLEEPPIVG